VITALTPVGVAAEVRAVVLLVQYYVLLDVADPLPLDVAGACFLRAYERFTPVATTTIRHTKHPHTMIHSVTCTLHPANMTKAPADENHSARTTIGHLLLNCEL
jgi:hypothetical protein